MSQMPQDADFWEVTWRFEGKEFETLRNMVEEITFPAQANVFEEGDEADGMYLVLEGYALVVMVDKHGVERTVGIVAQGQSFGELGLLINKPRMATVSAGTQLRVLKITPQQLAEIEAKAPDVTSILYKQLARTLAEQLVSSGQLRTRQEQ